MFNIVLNDGSPLPTDDVFYIIGKDGVYLKKSLGIIESVAPVKNISILQAVTPTAKMNIEKIQGKWFAKIVGFFREVYRQYRSESIVLLFYNSETKHHKIIPPHQKVAGAACDYDKGITIDGYNMIGTIHSHGSMSAFHSGVDDKDEEHFDGLHITIGNVTDVYPSVSASIVVNGYRIVIDPREYIDNMVVMEETNPAKDNKAITTKYRWYRGKMVVQSVEQAKYHYSYYGGVSKFDRRYDVIIPERDRVFNKKWMDMVERGVYTYKSYSSGWYGYNAHGYAGGGDWGRNFDKSLWGNRGKNLPAVINGKSPLNVGPSATIKPVQFPPHNADGEFIPCTTCVHRECKIIDEIDDEDYEDTYQCTKCGQIVKEEEGTILQCLDCLTDEYLILLEKDNLTENYIQGIGSYNHSNIFKETDLVSMHTKSEFVTCKACGSGFHMTHDNSICPFCQTPVNEEYSSEESLVAQSSADSGSSLDQEAENANRAALEEAKNQDKTLEKIPVPGSDSIPLPEQGCGDSGLMSMFKKVFKGERDA